MSREHDDKRYIVLPFNQLTTTRLKACIQTDVDNLRVSSSGNYILKFNLIDGAVPDPFVGLTILSRSDIDTELIKAEWSVT